jgi:TetR/AcrR family transcriptional regulator, tetracycline repressor protein
VAKKSPDPLREPLSRERLLVIALDIVDSDGIEGLSMRRLASAVKVEAASLYYWFPNKRSIIEGVVEAIRAEAFDPNFDQTTPWQETLEYLGIRYRAALMRHPRALPAFSKRPVLTERGLSYVEVLLETLRNDGLTVRQANRALSLVAGLVTGLCVTEASPGYHDEPGVSEEEFRALGALLPADQFPRLIEVLSQTKVEDGEVQFLIGLRALIQGLELQMAAE